MFLVSTGAKAGPGPGANEKQDRSELGDVYLEGVGLYVFCRGSG